MLCHFHIKLILSSCVFLTVLAAGCAKDTSKRPRVPGKPDFANIHYGPHERNVLDFWMAPSSKPTPVLVFFHGGGFLKGDKRLTLLQRKCLSHGISAASANYRLVGPEGIRILESMHDGARVVQFLRSKAKEWNIDAELIGLSGFSAGGCIAVWIALHDDLAKPESSDPVQRYSSRVTFAIGHGTQTTVDPPVILAEIGGNKKVHECIPAAYDVASVREVSVNARAREIAAECSAINHATRDDPPLYLQYLAAPPENQYPETAPIGRSIHSAKFGLLAKEKLDPLGVECIVSYPGHVAEEKPIDFARRHWHHK
jgi:acetyl esterase/lipase